MHKLKRLGSIVTLLIVSSSTFGIILYSDTFECEYGSEVWDMQSPDCDAGRFGYYAVCGYLQMPTAWSWQHQVRTANELLISGGGKITIDKNFNGINSDGGFEISVDIAPARNAAISNDNWCAVTIGADRLDDVWNDGFSVLFRKNGTIQVFDNGFNLVPDTVVWNPAPDSNYHAVRITANDAGDNNPFDGSGIITCEIYVDGVSIYSVELDGSVYINNYVNLQGQWEENMFDNLVVSKMGDSHLDNSSPVTQLLFGDDFNHNISVTDINLGLEGAGGRIVAGMHADTMQYLTTGEDWRTQVNNQEGTLRPYKLLIYGSQVSPDHNFNGPDSNGGFELYFDAWPAEGDISSSLWIGVTIGSDSPMSSPDDTNGGFGILIRSYGMMSLWDDEVQYINDNRQWGSWNGIDPIKVLIRATGINDVNPFDGSGQTRIEVFINDELAVYRISDDANGYSNNYITLSGGDENNLFDNLSIRRIENPNIISEPYPPTNELSIPVDVICTWDSPAAYVPTTYDFYLGTNPDSLMTSPQYVSLGQSEQSFDPSPDLDYSTAYYWKVISYQSDSSGTDIPYSSEIYEFTTEIQPPAVLNRQPVDNSGNLDADIVLSWSPSDTFESVAYDIYLDTDQSKVLGNYRYCQEVSVGQTNTFYYPLLPLLNGQSYYWKIIAHEPNSMANDLVHESSMWKFTIEQNPSPDITDDGFINMEDFDSFSKSWQSQLGYIGYNPSCDFIPDGEINISDLAILANKWLGIGLEVNRLSCEYLFNPIGIDTATPRFAWQIYSDYRQAKQSAWRILVATSPERLTLETVDVWDSGKISGDDQVGIIYNGVSLVSGRRYYWKTRIWDQDNCPSEWSDVAWFETGLLGCSEWNASWIGGDGIKCVRKEFSINSLENIQSARIYVTAKGLYELYLNGEKVGVDVLSPRSVRYDLRSFYSVYDVTNFLQTGENCIGMLLGGGGYQRFYDSTHRSGLVQLVIQYTDGSSQKIVSDVSWKETSQTPVVWDELYEGETYDARLEMKNWSRSEYDDDSWSSANAQAVPEAYRLSSQLVPIKVIEEIHPVTINEPVANTYVFDLRQNIAGWVQLRTNGNAGTQIQIRFGETLNADGTVPGVIGHDSKETYILKGGPMQEVWEPRFFYTGFRYVQVTGFPEVPTLDSIVGKVIHSEIKPAGNFECSDGLLNQIHRNFIWAFRGNIHGIATDCPTREKLGWLGDALVCSQAACLNYDITRFYLEWFYDFEDDQYYEGSQSYLIPHPPAWGKAVGDIPWCSGVVSIPLDVYMATGDKSILRDNYQRMKRFAGWAESQARPDHIHEVNQWADWAGIESTDQSLLSTIFYHRIIHCMEKIAEILGKIDDKQYYSQLKESIKTSFNTTFFDSQGFYLGNTQAANALALFEEMVPQDKIASVLNGLVGNIESRGIHLSTGVIGTYALLEVLTQNDRFDVACELVTQNTYPSWGHMIQSGSTTSWEYWDGRDSRNHVMLSGPVDLWFYQHILGIQMLEAGYQKIKLQPRTAGLSWAKGYHDCLRGRIVSDWKIENGLFLWDVSVPPNSTAEILIPTSDSSLIQENGQAIYEVEGIKYVGDTNVSDTTIDATRAVLEVGSGDYHFVSPVTVN